MALKITEADSTFPGLAPNHIPFESLIYQGPVGNTQTLHLYPGWNLISTYISAASFNSDSTGGATASALAIINAFNTNQNQGVALQASDYTNDDPDYPYILIFKNNAGSATLPQYQFNGVGNLVNGQGYQLKLIVPSSYAPTQTTPLILSGTLQQYSSAGLNQVVTISLTQGWNLIAMPLTQAVDMSVIFAAVVAANKLTIAKDYAGNAFLPEYNYNGIGNMIPGQGYQAKVTENVTLSFDNDLLFGSVAEPEIQDDDDQVVVDNGNIETNFSIFIPETKVESFFNTLNEDVQITDIRIELLDEFHEIFEFTQLAELFDTLGVVGFFQEITKFVYKGKNVNKLFRRDTPKQIIELLHKIQEEFDLRLYGFFPVPPYVYGIGPIPIMKNVKPIIQRDFRLQVVDPGGSVVASSQIIERNEDSFKDVSIAVGYVASKTLTFRLIDQYNGGKYYLTSTGDAVSASVDAIIIINSLSLANGVKYGTGKR